MEESIIIKSLITFATKEQLENKMSKGGIMKIYLCKETKEPCNSDIKCNCNNCLAEEFAIQGTVKHFALRLGFMPHDEADAETIIENYINEKEGS
jgi:hypothetical protein